MSSSSSTLAATSIALSAYAINEVSKDGELQIDFFCKTEENKTELEIQYCEEFYDNKILENWVDGGIILAFIIFIVIMFQRMKN
jgi:hypothetical protein